MKHISKWASALGVVLGVAMLGVVFTAPALAEGTSAAQASSSTSLPASTPMLSAGNASVAAQADAQLLQAVLAVQAAQAQEATEAGSAPAAGATPAKSGLDPIWSAIKNGETGRTSSQSAYSNSLINSYDPALIQSRAGWLSTTLALALFGMIVVFALFVLVNGPSKLEKGYSGTNIQRWPKIDVIVHWLMAIPCLLLILTGLSLMAGRFVFGDLLGPEGLAALAAFAKPVHDYMAIPFMIFAVIAMLRWMKHNIPASYDLKWFLVAGGYLNFGPFKGQHPDSGFSNAGEKVWFWCFTLFGLGVIGSGLVMLFPTWFEPSRTTVLTAIFIHGLCAVILTGFTVVHIFMATVLSEGGLPAMLSGYVDENWAYQHHNVWYDEIKSDGTIRYQSS